MTVQAAAKRLKEQNNILLLTHANADGDTLGSARALCLALRALGKRVRVQNEGGFAQKLAFLLPDEEYFKEDFVVSVDCAEAELLGDALCEEYGGKIDLCIDHHPSCTRFGRENLVEPTCAACGELIYKLICELGVPINCEMARALYVAISTDTGCFKYSNTTAQTHKIVSKIMEHTGDVSGLNFTFFTEKSALRLELEARVLGTLHSAYGGRVMTAAVSFADIEACGGDKVDKDDLSDLPRCVEGVQLSALFKQADEKRWHVSVRTNGGEINASDICAVFGGGGHKGAGGCDITGTIEQAREKFYKAVEGIF